MTISKNTLFAIVGLCLIGFSCQRHKIVPKPEVPVEEVEVDCSFSGLADLILNEFSEGVNGYGCLLLSRKEIEPAPILSEVVYSDSLGSQDAIPGIRLDLGSFEWINDPSMDNPSISEFQAFFEGNNLQTKFGDSVSIPYSNDAANGVQITFVDSNGTVYYSRDTSTYSGRYFELNGITYEADNSNEYVKWTANFTCEMFTANGLDSMVLSGASFVGAFSRRNQ